MVYYFRIYLFHLTIKSRQGIDVSIIQPNMQASCFDDVLLIYFKLLPVFSPGRDFMPAVLLLTIHWIHMPSRDHRHHKEVMDLLPGIEPYTLSLEAGEQKN
ncbi:hypothetical protein [Salmonella enterica]|uniref:hypothetical protein n=1 Tax=Salmonella enterica TaxID=28901 RepID=UPI001C48D742|nr:hypothetical protein [Salmonella enterica]EED7440860.1 hypothetical protein [Salmonella enterica subsp. salamae]EEP8432808.1 hypothetical protein [Salmonella enterica subsp. salamae]EKN4992532.1 hypothetical protein [Salmonella enterica]ELI6866214.1 hypothetical protein [Salmonella enterica]